MVLNSNTSSSNFPFFPSENEYNGKSTVREWLIDGGDPNGREPSSGDPWWVICIQRQWIEAVDELLASGADPNQRRQNGEGWLHLCIQNNMPLWLVAQGFKKLKRGWWYPSEEGKTPFDFNHISPGLLQMMYARWWSDGYKNPPQKLI